MALLWADSFSRYGTDIGKPQDGLYAQFLGSLVPDPDPNVPEPKPYVWQVGRTLDNSPVNDSRWPIPKTTKNIGCAARFWLDGLPSNQNAQPVIFALRKPDNDGILNLTITPTGSLQVNNLGNHGGAYNIIDTGVPVVGPHSWNHFEMFVDTTQSTDAVELRVNGTYVWKGNLTAPTNQDIGLILFTPRSLFLEDFWLYMKDFVVWDNTGTRNNTFFGNVLVGAQVPDGDITMGGWTAPAGKTGSQVLAANPPNDAEPISVGILPQDGAEFSLSNLPDDVSSVRGVVVVVRARKSDSGDANYRVGLERNGDTKWADERPLTTAMTYRPDVFETDPSTNSTITPGFMNDMHVKIERTL